ncbi:MAG: metallophosphoesterase [Deltaproteobacteria bacterium]|nr:metallophosphoesterase [Deltaproteobacteria bacterium]
MIRSSAFYITTGVLTMFSVVTLAPSVHRWWAGAQGRRRRWLLGAALTSFSLGLEVVARGRAPAGGGAYRWLVSFERSLALALWMAAFVASGLRVLSAVVWKIHDLTAKSQIETEFEPSPSREETLDRREVIARAMDVATLSTASVFVGYGLLKGRSDFRVREVVLAIPNLPRTLEGYAIAQLTDIHVGMFTGVRDFASVIEKTQSLRTDSIVLTGDLLDSDVRHIPEAMRLFAQLHARDGVFAILGNHDYYTGHLEVLHGLRRAGIRTLVNENTRLRARDAGGIVLAGVDELMAARWFADRGVNLDAALDGIERGSPTVLLAHNPKVFEQAKGRVDAQLSGHTHGGQLNIAGMMEPVLGYCSGLYHAQASTLFVSNGLGFTGPPIRFNAPPEVVKIVLTRTGR